MSEANARVLIVEDSDTQAIRLVTLLEQTGISAVRVPSAEAALDYLTGDRPDLIAIDYHLPRMRGDELCRQIRLNPATKDIAVVMLTGDMQDSIERQGLESGADDHIPKSTDPDRLLARISSHLRGRRASASGALASSAAFFQRHRLVAVDDSPTFLVYLAEELGTEGYDVATFTDPEEAFTEVNRNGCDCALVDLVMPKIDGISLCRKLDSLRSENDQWFPLLMVTTHDHKQDMMRALDAGADDFVGKSSDATILKARIRALLRRKVQRDEHDRIAKQFRDKELEVVRERAEREAAERRAALAEQLEIANRELKEAQAQLVQAAKMASLGELVAGIAHEINNPLAFVMSHLDTVERNLAGLMNDASADLAPHRPALAKARTRLSEMRGGLDRVQDLVQKLRTFSRLDEGEFQRADIRESIESVLAILRHRITENIALETTFAEDNTIRCFPAPLNQAVMNLLSNAIDAVGEKGLIQVATERTKTCFRIVISDDGPGFPPGVRERIFEPFYTTKPVGKGMGLGLSIAYRIIQSHKGTIEARERNGGGAQFILSIPLDLEDTSHDRGK